MRVMWVSMLCVFLGLFVLFGQTPVFAVDNGKLDVTEVSL